jgi:ubiquinone/menaquinone biosynthesis C-methylase UbiE
MWEKTSNEDNKIFDEKGYAITYGELTLDGLKTIMEKVNNKNNKVFVDLGSGNGDIVINAIKEFPELYMSIGVELSKTRHDTAFEKYVKQPVKLQNKIKLLNNDILDDGFDYSDFDIIYISNLCFSENINIKLSDKIKRECKQNTQIFCSKPLIGINKINTFRVRQTWTDNSVINYYTT